MRVADISFPHQSMKIDLNTAEFLQCYQKMGEVSVIYLALLNPLNFSDHLVVSEIQH